MTTQRFLALIEELRSEGRTIAEACAAAGVSTSSYYSARRGDRGVKAGLRDDTLEAVVNTLGIRKSFFTDEGPPNASYRNYLRDEAPVARDPEIVYDTYSDPDVEAFVEGWIAAHCKTTDEARAVRGFRFRGGPTSEKLEAALRHYRAEVSGKPVGRPLGS